MVVASLGGVIRIDRHVLLREVREEHLGLGALAGQSDLVLDLLALHEAVELELVVGDRSAGRADLHALDRHVDGQRRGAGERAADGLHDASPVRIPAVQRGLDEGRVGDRAGGCLDVVLVSAAHDHPRRAPGALAVDHHHHGQLAKQGVQRLAEAQLVLALGGDRDRGGAGGHQDRRVVGRELAVHRSAVEGALHAYTEQQVGGLGRQRRVCLYEAQHRGELRRDHAGALALRAEPDSAGVERAAWKSASPPGSRRSRAARMLFRTFSTGRYWLMPPVEARATAAGSTPAASAAAPWVLAASSRPRPPVAALAQPELTSTARSAPSVQRSWLRSTGAAAAPDEVKRAALTGSAASLRSSPRSGRPLGLRPAATPPARNPAGSPESGASSATCPGLRTQPERKKASSLMSGPAPPAGRTSR